MFILSIPFGDSIGSNESEKCDRHTASQLSDQFTLKLLDSDGHDLSDPLFGGEVIIYFDTISTDNGVIYKLKAMLSIKTIPANLVIESTGGLFTLSAKVSGIDSFLNDTGMRITIVNSEDAYCVDLTKSNNFSDDFKHGSNLAALGPNTYYAVSFNLIDGYDSTVAPEDVKDITITFQATASEGFHQVMFISQDETIESYMAFDNYVIEEVPSVSRSGYSFLGWQTPDGKEIAPGYVISSNDGDIIAYAQWEKNESNSYLIPVIGGTMGLLAVVAAIVVFALKKKKEEDNLT